MSRALTGAPQKTASTGMTAGELAAKRGRGGEVRAGRARGQRPYDPTKDARDLYDAMHGGLGWGTDEAKVFKALEGKTPAQIEALEAEYQDHYGRDLRADLKSELGGSDLRRANAALAGDLSAAKADRLAQAMNGLGTNEQEIFATLRGTSAKERAAIRAAYETRHGEKLEDRLKSELGGTNLERAQALLRGDAAAADAARLHGAMDGLGTDEAAVYATLKGRSAEDIGAIKAAYAKRYGGGDSNALQKAIEADFGGAEKSKALSLLAADDSQAGADELKRAMEGLGTDEAAIEKVFQGKTPAERQAIESAFEKTYGSLDAALESELSRSELDRVNALRKNGALSAAEEIHFATQGLGTDEAAIHRALKGKTKAEIAALRADYTQRYGQDLDAVLESELGGRDLFEAQLALRGKPETAAEARELANARYAYEREGTWNSVSNAIVDTFSDAGRVADRNHRRMNAAYAKGMANASLSAVEAARVEKLAGNVNADVEAYRKAEDSVSDGVGTVAATAAGVAVVVGTGGLATPALVALAAGSAGAARVAAEAVVSGSSYSGGAALEDGALGAVDGAFAVVGGGAANAMARKLAARTVAQRAAGEVAEASLKQRVLAGAAQGAVDGGLGGAAGGAAESAIRGETWKNGVVGGLKRVGQGAGMGMAAGVAFGGVLGGGFSAKPPKMRGADGAPSAKGADADPPTEVGAAPTRDTVGWGGSSATEPQVAAVRRGQAQIDPARQSRLDDAVWDATHGNRAYKDELDGLTAQENELLMRRHQTYPDAPSADEVAAIDAQLAAIETRRLKLQPYQQVEMSRAQRRIAHEMQALRQELLDAGDLAAAERKAAALRFDASVSDPEAARAAAVEFFRITKDAVEPSRIRKVIQKRVRAHADPQSGVLDFGKAGKTEDLWHELGHFAEWNKPDIYEAAAAWRRARAEHAGYDPDKLVQINKGAKPKPGEPSPKPEYAVEDHFTSKYVGRHYGPDRTTEVFTTGIQNFADPETMAQLYLKDPEQFFLVLGMVG